MTLTPSDFDYVRSLVQKRAAIVLESDKLYLAESRLLNLAQREKIPSVSHLMNLLRTGERFDLPQKVIEAMTTNETSFFRDEKPFDVLRTVVLPDLVKRRTATRRLNVWCCACSTGQEPYTVAMIVREHLLAYPDWTASILATDLSTEVLERARQGRYNTHEVGRGLSQALLMKYFVRQGNDWLVADELKRLVEFRQLNLIDPWPALPAMDIVLLRNVLIYFDVATKKQLLGRARKLLRADGYLFLGGGETTHYLDDAFEHIEVPRAGCYRIRGGR